MARLFNLATEGVKARLGFHICFGNRLGRSRFLRSYGSYFPGVLKARADEVMLEFAGREMSEVELWQKYSDGRGLGAGLMDVKGFNPDTAKDVAWRIRKVPQHCSTEKITSTRTAGSAGRRATCASRSSRRSWPARGLFARSSRADDSEAPASRTHRRARRVPRWFSPLGGSRRVASHRRRPRMARIIVLGGGIVGLPMGMMLRHDAHDVTVLERDREAPPTSLEDAWASWDRRGVGQFRQPHYLQPAGRLLLEHDLPEVATTLYGEGGTPFEVLQLLPATVADRAPRPGDERLFSVAACRPVLEHAVAGVAGRLLDVRRRVSVNGVLTGAATANGVPHVTGVRLASGETIHGDLVIDAMGRTSPAPDWLGRIGARRPLEEAEDQGFVYYSRYFRTRTGKAPEFRTSLLMHLEAFSILSLPTDAQGRSDAASPWG